jgi:hypothetical protein
MSGDRDSEGPDVCVNIHDIRLCASDDSNRKTANIPYDIFCVNIYSNREPNSSESGIRRCSSSIDVNTDDPKNVLNLDQTVLSDISNIVKY